MKHASLTLTLAVILLMTGNFELMAQNDSCSVKLKNANIGFDQGDYDGTVKLLRSALAECQLDKIEKIQANKLLTMSYLKIDNLEEADKVAASIMKIDPYYKPDKFKDDPAYCALFEKYQPTPVFRVGIIAGANFSQIDVVKAYSIVHDDENATNYSEYNSKTGFQIGVQGEYRAYKNLWVELGACFRQSQYEHILDSVENTTINYSEKLSYFDIPLSAKYYFLNKSFCPYLEAGATFSFLTDALSTTQRNDLNDLINRTDYRNTFMMGYFGGAGIAYKMKGFQVFADFRYVYYPENVNKEGTRYADEVNVFKYYYIDDDFRLDNLMVNFGVSYTLSYRNQKVK